MDLKSFKKTSATLAYNKFSSFSPVCILKGFFWEAVNNISSFPF